MSYRGIDTGQRSLVGSLLKALLVLIILALITGIVWGTYRLSDQIAADALEVTEFEPSFSVTVREVFTGEIGLANRTVAETRLDRDEVAGLQWFGGFGQVTGLVDSRIDTVIRQFAVFEGERPNVGDQVHVDHLAYRGDPEAAHGIAFEDVTVPGPVGSLPAWLIDGRADTWVVMVHDIGDRGRAEFLRVIPALHQAGFPMLVTSYRNDDAAPQTDGRRHTYGLTEAADVEAAVQFALDRGASDVVVFGIGAGGSAALSFVYDSTLVSSVAGLILEAPITDLEEQIYEDSAELRIPGTQIQLPRQMTWLALRLMERRWQLDFDRSDYLARASELSVPTLLIRNGADETINPEQSDGLVARRGDLVQLVDFATAGHGRAWNVDPSRYEQVVTDWLREVGS